MEKSKVIKVLLFTVIIFVGTFLIMHFDKNVNHKVETSESYEFYDTTIDNNN